MNPEEKKNPDFQINRWPFLDLIEDLLPRDFATQIFETFSTRVSLIVLGVLTTALVARSIGPEGRGFYAVAVTIGAIGVQLGNLGLHASNTFVVAQQRGLLTKLVANSLFVSFVLGGGGALIVWMFFVFSPAIAPLHGLLLVLALAWIPLGLAQMLLQNILLGIGEVRLFNLAELLARIVTAVFIGAVIVIHKATAASLFLATVLGLTIGLGWTLLKLTPFMETIQLVPSLDLLAKHFRYGLKAYAAAFFSFLVLRIDLLMVRYLLNAKQVGYYSIAVSMADMTYLLPVVMGTLLFPRLSTLSDNSEKRRLTKKTAIIVAGFMALVGIFSVSFSGMAIRLLFGPAFLPAVDAFVWLMPGLFFLSINVILMNYFASVGLPMVTVYSPAISALVNIGLNIKLIPLLGIKGASISSIAAYAMMLICSLIALRNMEFPVENRL